ncbi:bifunctional DedA family/phosphatase PAP2 family protein [Paraburkholderia hospita]|uniref:Phosphatidic acid phosphatase type 2/haloperoxidase domain-containing protein n=3 Tax=Paraburkholderia hospita TaxID=169430 RepID=A0ABP2PB81_9BURK|nr:bifunctional DedA family/phosphatase PAP2 family protein [Paraburkholderia hospita]EIM94730.1 hypothetical protein WQE_42809 [Paraburkholderia hospita]OUL83282.1 phosphoesterase [Paraburkholderia hospita]
MEYAYVRLLHLLAAHPAWTLMVVFVAAFLEAIAVIGTFVPGSTAMFVAGALVGAASLNLAWVFVWAIVGAILGDGVSYWLGSRYKDRIVQVWPFRTHPQVLSAGHRFFAKHGAKSVVFARFIGPLRAIVPVVAGMLGMAPMRFYAINILSALLWAPAHILPGVVFGASVRLAGAVSFRLAVVILLLVGIIWSSARLARAALLYANARASTARRRLAIWAHQRKGVARRIVLSMLDPSRPAAGGIVAASLMVLLSAWLFFVILEGVIGGEPLVRLDVSVYHFLRSVRTSWGDVIISVFGILGSITTLAAIVVVVAGWMVWERRWRTVGYWLICVGFSQLLIVAIQLAIHRAPPDKLTTDFNVFPSNHVAAATIVYGFLAFLLARRVGRLERLFVAMTSVVFVVVIALAGVYFGRFWLSDAVGGATLSAVWVAIVALITIWRNPDSPSSKRFLPVIMLLLVSAVVMVQINVNPGILAPDSARRPALILVTQALWTGSLSRTLPCFRFDVAGERGEPFALQWAARSDQIRSQLRTRGWIEGTDISARSLLSLASPDAAAMALPVLPELNDGVPSPLNFKRPGNTRGERDVLRLWQSGYAVNHVDGASPVPIWVGSLSHEQLTHGPWPFNILRVEPLNDVQPEGRGRWLAGTAVAQLGNVDCVGTAVSMLESL